MQFAYVLEFRASCKWAEIETEADLDVPLGKVVAVNQDFVDLVSGIGG